MRAYEFITESGDPDDRKDALQLAGTTMPNTFVIPSLTNQDFYELYRFGLAIASVRGDGGQDDGVQNSFKPKFRAASEWGEHQVVTSFDPNIGSVIDKALKKVNKSGKKQMGTATSDEQSDVDHVSPVKPFKGYSK